MFLNIVFLAGGICVGYLLRGEMDRRKSKKAWTTALDEGIKVAEKWLAEFTAKQEADEDEIEEDDDETGTININSLGDIINLVDSSNSTDETIKL